MCGVVVDDDDVGPLVWTNVREVEPLARDIAGPVTTLDLPRREERSVADERAPQRLLECGRDEDAQFPEVEKLATEQEDAVEEQDRVVRRPQRRLGSRLVGDNVEDRPPILAASAGAERMKQRPAQNVEIERVVVVARGRISAPPVALPPRPVEAVDRGADHMPTSPTQHPGQLVCERRLPGRVDTVDRDADGMRRPARLHDVRKPLEESLPRHAA
jgi:hypothetical protein